MPHVVLTHVVPGLARLDLLLKLGDGLGESLPEGFEDGLGLLDGGFLRGTVSVTNIDTLLSHAGQLTCCFSINSWLPSSSPSDPLFLMPSSSFLACASCPASSSRYETSSFCRRSTARVAMDNVDGGAMFYTLRRACSGCRVVAVWQRALGGCQHGTVMRGWGRRRIRKEFTG